MSDIKNSPKKPINIKSKTKADLAKEIEMKSMVIDELESQLEANEQLKILTEERGALNDQLVNKLMDVELKLASSALESQRLTAQNIIKTHMAAGSALALLPVPLFDLAVLTGTQVSLLRSLSTQYGVDFNEKRGKVLLTSLISGSIPLLAVVGLSSFAKLIPGIGTLGGGISMTILAGSIIYASGQVFARHFEQGGTLNDFESKHWKSFFTQQFEEIKTELKQSNSPKTTDSVSL